MSAAAPDRGKKITMLVEGQQVVMSRAEVLRIAAGRQLAEVIQWLAANVHRTDKGRPIDHTRNQQWEEIYADPSPDLRIMASAQTGKSLYMTIRTFACGELGYECACVVPTHPKRSEFVANRIDRTIEYTPYYRERIKHAGGSDSVSEKQYRSRDGSICALHFATAASDNELISFSADAMNIDERDRCNRQNLALYPSRMNQSDYRLTYECSTPTFPGSRPTHRLGEIGEDNIHSQYLSGDQRRMYLTCTHCGLRQAPTWDENVVKIEYDEAGRTSGFRIRDGDYTPGQAQDLRVMCCAATCGQPMDRLGRGVWIPDSPFIEIAGRRVRASVRSYWVNRLLSDVGEPLSKILEKFAAALNNPSAMQQVYNMDLGLPYAGGAQQFRKSMFDDLVGDYAMYGECREGMVTAGIDVNEPYYDVSMSRWNPADLDRPQTKIHVSKIQGKDNLLALLKRFGVRVAVIDQQPSLELACDIQRDAPTACGARIVRSRYSTHPMVEPMVISEKGAYEGDLPKMITLDRTATIDRLYQNHLNRRIRYFRDYSRVLDGAFLAEMCRAVRAREEDPSGQPRFVWVGKPDHQMHAANFDQLAGEVGGMFLVRYSDKIAVRRVSYTRRAGAPIENSGGPPEAALNAMLRSRGFR